MVKSMNAPTECPQGCGYSGKPHHVAAHRKGCLYPRTVERLLEIVGGSQCEDKCWDDGTYLINIDGKMRRVYRVLEELLNGTIPDGIVICHRCDNRKCCNPSHLFRGTPRDNMRDCAAKGRLGGAVVWTTAQRQEAGLSWSRARAKSLESKKARRVTKNCTVCGIEVSRPPSMSDRLFFCSKECLSRRWELQRQGVQAARKIGPVQQKALEDLRMHGGTWYPYCGWSFSGTAHAGALLKPLVLRGLVVKIGEGKKARYTIIQ